MRFIIMHRTDARWEAGAKPDAALIERVGKLIGEIAATGAFVGGEGLRSSALGVRVEGPSRGRALTKGPFAATDGLPNGFVGFRAASLEEAAGWARRIGEALGDVVLEVRPVNEPWHIGLVPEPAGMTTQRYLAVHKDPAAAHGRALTDVQRASLAKVLDELRAKDLLVTEVSLLPSGSGTRFTRAGGKFSMTDGPFAEAKELIGGFSIVDVPTREAAVEWGRKYALAVDSDEVEVRELAGADGRAF